MGGVDSKGNISFGVIRMTFDYLEMWIEYLQLHFENPTLTPKDTKGRGWRV